jgi:tRNA U34 5-methylaminomethyl-2-thiouridine-forming methyltransferase MnmC
MQNTDYKIVRLVNGTYSVHSVAERETFHPVIGPVAEAEALYVKQLKLRERLAKHAGEFVIWDVGLGAAANVLTALRATHGLAGSIHVLSFDHTIEPLRFALQHATELGYFGGYETHVSNLLQDHRTTFSNGEQTVQWELHLGDFPEICAKACGGAPGERDLPAPHAILFDAFSPAKNPAMWSAPLFANLFRLLDPQRPCAMPTYSRSTMLRVTLLLAGFFVGVGHATGEKEETTIAANTLELLNEPLDATWLPRVRASKSAEPMWESVYRQAHITPATWEKLQQHPQFKL